MVNTDTSLDVQTVEPRFNEPQYDEILGITNDFLQPGQSYSKMHETEPWHNEPRYNERKPKIYLDIPNKCKHVIKDECQTECQTNKDKIYLYSSFKQFCLPVL